MSDVSYKYEKMVGGLEPSLHSDTDLNLLARQMIEPRPRIPSGYTYLGQFIDHDITLELSRTGKAVEPWGKSEGVENFRTPFLNLETLYGFEEPARPTDGPPRSALLQGHSKTLLKLGDTLPTSSVKDPLVGRDLPRQKDSPEAILVDPRNDENLAVAQTHVIFIRFHNAVVDYLCGRRKDAVGKPVPNSPNLPDTSDTFEKAREIVISYYQWIVLHDYLPKVIKRSVLSDVLADGNNFYFPDPAAPYIPLEFSVAAFRMGHSMIRNSYNWNRFFNDDQLPTVAPATLENLMVFTGGKKLGGYNHLIGDWVINWNWFYPVSTPDQKQKLNLAEPFDTKLAALLASKVYDRRRSVAALDLYRGRYHELPSGQAIATEILGSSDRVLKPQQVANLLAPALKARFSEETPLWFYLLAESEIEEHGCRMGEVGSRILAEVFVKLIRLSRPSILKSGFRPARPYCDNVGEFGMSRMLKFVANGDEKELNPLGDCNC